MTETASGTNGGQKGTSGGSDWALIGFMAAIISLFGLVNATSGVMEDMRGGPDVPAWHFFLLEYSSTCMWVALTPALILAQRRWPFGPPWAKTVALHAALTVPVSLVHVSGMVALREIVWWLVYRGRYDYNFLHDTPGLVLFYEWRKDVLSYLLLSTLIWGWDRLRRPSAAPQTGPATIEIRDGSRLLFLPTAEVYWLEAAGNYVEVHAAAQTHLVRGTLAGFETRLAAEGFVRVHRSRLVNRARVRAVATTDAGDFTLTFDDGRTLGGSRRYRAGLDARPASSPAP